MKNIDEILHDHSIAPSRELRSTFTNDIVSIIAQQPAPLTLKGKIMKSLTLSRPMRLALSASALAAIAGGIFAYSTYQDTSKTTVSSNEKTTPAVMQPAPKRSDLTKEQQVAQHSWITYRSPDNTYTIKLPDGWKLNIYEDSSSPYTISMQNLTYLAGTKASVTPTTFAGDISHVAFAMSAGADGLFGQEPRGVKAKTFTTKAGLTVDRYDYTEVESEFTYPETVGMVRYEYRINHNGKTFQVIHDVLKGETAQTELVEQVIDTVTLL